MKGFVGECMCLGDYCASGAAQQTKPKCSVMQSTTQTETFGRYFSCTAPAWPAGPAERGGCKATSFHDCVFISCQCQTHVTVGNITPDSQQVQQEPAAAAVLPASQASTRAAAEGDRSSSTGALFPAPLASPPASRPEAVR